MIHRVTFRSWFLIPALLAAAAVRGNTQNADRPAGGGGGTGGKPGALWSGDSGDSSDEGPGTVRGHRRIERPFGSLGRSDFFGSSVAAVGDLDRDGNADLVVGARGDHILVPSTGLFATGAVWVLFLESDGTLKSFQKISAVEGGFTGELGNGDRFGNALAALGDLDGDGVQDVAVGAPHDEDGGSLHGSVWVLFLNTDGTVKAHQKIGATEGNFTPSLFGADFGRSLAAVGDLDGDGVGDLVVGGIRGAARGALWVLFLNTDGTVKAQERITKDDGGFVGEVFSGFATSVANLGDLNDDGVVDLAVGATSSGGADSIWILFLNPDGTVQAQQEISDTEGGFTGTLSTTDGFGSSVAPLGDLDGDGLLELVVGAPEHTGTGKGTLWVLSLYPDGTVASHRRISEGEGGFVGDLDPQDGFGESAGAIGDLNGDGVVDLAAGTPFDDAGDNAAGALRVLFMNTEGTVDALEKISAADSIIPLTSEGEEHYGRALASIGDWNDDGYPDLAVGAPLDDDEEPDGTPGEGAVWLQFLTPDGRLGSHRKIGGLTPGFGGVLDDQDAFGASIANLGDSTGDGVVELVVGAPGDDDGGTDTGALWLLSLDQDGRVLSHRKISATAGGFTGELAPLGRFGFSVAVLGDLDEDGITELAVGAPGEFDNPSAADAGAVWVLFLRADGTVKSQTRIAQDEGGFDGILDPGDAFGFSVASPGDLDRDGVEDLAVGARFDDFELAFSNEGAVWILFLDADGSVKRHQKIGEDQGGFTGVIPRGEWFGSSLAALPDLNCDGVRDLAVGAVGDRDGGFRHGAVWILFLESDGTVGSHQKISETRGGFTGALSRFDLFGISVVPFGDLDGDGVVDLAVGSPGEEALWVLFLDGFGAIDFETEDDLVTPLVNGQAVSSAAEFGRALKIDGFPDSGLTAAVFDSTPGGPNASSSDPDLLVDLGNVLILQEKPGQTLPGTYDFPDDDRFGGDFLITFRGLEVEMKSIDLIDLCPTPGQNAVVALTDSEGNTRVYTVPSGWTEDVAMDGPPGFRTLDLTSTADQPGFVATATATEDEGFQPTAVVMLDVHLGGSAALDNLVYDPHP